MENSSEAGFWWRFLAAFIDGLILMIPLMIIAVTGYIVLVGLLGMDKTLVEWILKIPGIVIGWLYFALSESSPWQATLGKKFLGLSVSDLNQEPISFARASGRYFGKYLSNLTLFVGYIMVAFTARKQALHDKLAGTLVLKANKPVKDS